jgi:hypothetical protein
MPELHLNGTTEDYAHRTEPISVPDIPTVTVKAEDVAKSDAILNVMEGRLATMREDSNYEFDQMVDELRKKYYALTQRFKDEKTADLLKLRAALGISSGMR